MRWAVNVVLKTAVLDRTVHMPVCNFVSIADVSEIARFEMPLLDGLPVSILSSLLFLMLTPGSDSSPAFGFFVRTRPSATALLLCTGWSRRWRLLNKVIRRNFLKERVDL